MEKSSALVQGEDSESDEEEINTEHMTENSLSRVRGKAMPGIVTGEGSETDDEEASRGIASASGGSVEQTDGGASGGATLRVPSAPQRNVSGTSSPRSSRRSSGDSGFTNPPPS